MPSRRLTRAEVGRLTARIGRAVMIAAVLVLIVAAVPAQSLGQTADAARAASLTLRLTLADRQARTLHKQLGGGPAGRDYYADVVSFGALVVDLNRAILRSDRATQMSGMTAPLQRISARLRAAAARVDAQVLHLCRDLRRIGGATVPASVAAAARKVRWWAGYWRKHPRPGLTPVASSGAIDLDPPDGYTFNGGGVTFVRGPLSLGSDCTITGVNFSGGSLGLQITGSGNTIRDCTFGPYSWTALLLSLGNDNVIDRCTFNGVTGSGANIQILGGKRNRITNNVTKGGVTAIAFLYSRSVNGGGAASLIEDNVITGNTCSGFSEEGITFDIIGSSPVDTAALEYDRIRALGNSTVTLSPLSFPSYVGYDLIFLSGALRGQTRSIVSQTGATFSLSGSLAGAAVNDEVVIGATFKRNLVSGNTVRSSGSNWPAILLYGMAFGNRVEGNTVRTGGIKVESIDNLAVATGSATRTHGRAPSGYNTVRNNTVGGGVSLEYYAIPSINGHVNTYAPYMSLGNNVIGNRCARVCANRQVCYIANNSGARSYSHLILNPVEMLTP